jgi:transposase
LKNALPKGAEQGDQFMSKHIKKPAGETRRYVGIDLGDKKSRVCIVDEQGAIVTQEWVVTTPEAFLKRFGSEVAMCITMEVGTHSRWASDLLGRCGHDVRVADARQLALITNSDAKSDKRDARTLAQLLRADPRLLSPIEHRAETLQMDLTVVRMRDNLIETRTRLVSSVRGVVKATGARLPSCETAGFPQQVADQIPGPLRPALAPMLDVIDQLNEEIHEYNCLLEHWAQTRYQESSRLTQVKGVGTLTALTFMLTVGDKERFSRTRDIGSFLGLRPRLDQSGDSHPQLRITKAGDGLLRKTLVECAQYMVGPFGQDSDLRRWGLKMMEAGNGSKRARQRATVGVARRLAVLLMSLWKSGQSYDPLRHSRAQQSGAEVAA